MTLPWGIAAQSIALSFLIYVLWRAVEAYLKRRSLLARISGPPKEHWLKGSYHRIFQDGLKYNLELAEHYGGAVKIHALMGDKQLYVSDPRALHHIVVKDQHVYEETDMFIMGNKAIFGEGLIATLGEQHKKQRKMLNPVFSLANMRDLLPVIQPIAESLRDAFISQLPPDGVYTEEKEIDVMPWMSRGALEYICQAGLGYSFGAMDPSRASDYTKALRMLGPTSSRLHLIRPFVPFAMRNFSLYWRNKMLEWLPFEGLRDMKRISETMHRATEEILRDKRAAMSYSSGEKNKIGDLGWRMKGKDIMSIMLNANTSSTDSDRLTDSELIGQVTTLVFAGFETTATAICRILHILACEPTVQARLRREIRKAKQEQLLNADTASDRWEDVELPYDTLMSLPYLDAIIRETLRVHPPTSVLGRTVREDIVLPLQYPVRATDGSLLSFIHLPKDTSIMISIIAANHNKHVWGQDASEWKPERWLTASGERLGFGQEIDMLPGEEQSPLNYESKASGVGTSDGVKYPGVYASMMTFLGGGRACIGFKFAEMEIKQILVALLPIIHFSEPSTLGQDGHKKKIRWKLQGLQIPVVAAPAGDDVTPQVPLALRRVNATDF